MQTLLHTKASIALNNNKIHPADCLEHGMIYGLTEILASTTQQITRETVHDLFKNGLKAAFMEMGKQAFKELMIEEALAHGNVPVDDSLSCDGDSVTLLKKVSNGSEVKASVQESATEMSEQKDTTEMPRNIECSMFTVKEAAKYLGIGLNNAYALIKVDGFPHVRIGHSIRIPKIALDNWIAANPNIEDVLTQHRME